MLTFWLVVTLTLPNDTLRTNRIPTATQAICQRELDQHARRLTRMVENNKIKSFTMECKAADKPVIDID